MIQRDSGDGIYLGYDETSESISPPPEHVCEKNLVSLGASGLYCSICTRPILP